MHPFNWRSAKSIDEAALKTAREDFHRYPDDDHDVDKDFFGHVEQSILDREPPRARWNREKVHDAAYRFTRAYEDEMMRLGRLYDAVLEEDQTRGGSITSRAAATRVLRIDATLYDAVEKASRARGENLLPWQIAATAIRLAAARGRASKTAKPKAKRAPTRASAKKAARRPARRR